MKKKGTRGAGAKPEKTAGREAGTGDKPGKRCGKRCRASFSIEASYIMAMMFMMIAFVLRFGFSLHDAVSGNAILNEAIERIGHAPEGVDIDQYQEKAGDALKRLFSREAYDLQIEPYREGAYGKIQGTGYEKEMQDKGYCPVKRMRQLTLLEEVKQ